MAVVDGDLVMPVLTAWAAAADQAGVPVFVSRDWHPPRTTHFKAYGGVWPPHCVMGTHGASGFEHLLLGSVTEKVLRKASCPVLTVRTPFATASSPSTPVAEMMAASVK